jgi:hypothetical protein
VAGDFDATPGPVRLAHESEHLALGATMVDIWMCTVDIIKFDATKFSATVIDVDPKQYTASVNIKSAVVYGVSHS